MVTVRVLPDEEFDRLRALLADGAVIVRASALEASGLSHAAVERFADGYTFGDEADVLVDFAPEADSYFLLNAAEQAVQDVEQTQDVEGIGHTGRPA